MSNQHLKDDAWLFALVLLVILAPLMLLGKLIAAAKGELPR